jgi:hypothetical protein
LVAEVFLNLGFRIKNEEMAIKPLGVLKALKPSTLMDTDILPYTISYPGYSEILSLHEE